jgi:hypothetical protein
MRGLRAMKPFYYILPLPVNTLLLLPDPNDSPKISCCIIDKDRGTGIPNTPPVKKTEKPALEAVAGRPSGQAADSYRSTKKKSG